jgi:predicted nuclease of predicted toxin-antitoxin system
MKFLADEHIPLALIRGLLQREPGLDLVRVQDVGLRTEDDATLLAWAAQESRLVITLDKSTIPDTAYVRIEKYMPMPGVVILCSGTAIGQVIDELLTLAGASFDGEWENRVIYIPMQGR